MKASKSPGKNLIKKHRLAAIFIIILFLMLLLIARVGWLQIVRGEKLKKTAVDQWNSEVKIDAKRGEILDRNGHKLALSAGCKRIDAYIPDVVKKEKNDPDIKREVASKLAAIIGDKEENILKKLNMTLSNGLPANSVTIARRIDKSKGDEIEKLNLPGIVVSDDTKRYYPNGNLLSHVLGFTNIDGQGQEGIESKYDTELKGIPGTIFMQTDRLGRQLPYNVSKYNAPVNGNNLTLTIDESIQLYVEKALEDAVVKNNAKSATAIVMDPKTGEILAMAGKPDFNPNDPRNMSNYSSAQEMVERWKNKAVTFIYEPGSVFKLVTAAAALSENIADDNTTFDCHGYLTVAGRRIYDWRRTGDGKQDFAEILQNSCNVAFMELGGELGKDKLYQYIDAFGLGKKTGIDVSFEESGYGIPLNKVGPVELANISFGQGIITTPIQLVSAYAAIANQGKLMVPHLVKSIDSTDQEGNVISRKEIQPQVASQAVDADTANKMMGYLETVVTVGGGHSAYVEGYRIAGKTGTAQKAENGRYIPDKYVATFIGMAPVDDPKFVVFVAVDEPDPSNYYASHVVAPVGGQIFTDLFGIMEIPPEKSNEAGMNMVPDVIGLSQKDAESRLKAYGLAVESSGTGTTVEKTNPLPGVSLKAGSKITITLGDGSKTSNKVYVPDIIKMNKEEAKLKLDSLGLKLSITGKGFVASQNPKAGSIVNKGSSVSALMEEIGD